MQPRALIGPGAVAVALVAYAGWVTLAPRAPAPAPAPAEARPLPLEPARGAAVADALQRVMGPPPEPQIRLPPAEARRAAEESFEAMMRTLEELADAGKRVPRARRDELYRHTNDAFAALSAELDANDADDRQVLEDANIRMKAMLQELGVRVPKRPLPPQ
jgi:hypothetical protein